MVLKTVTNRARPNKFSISLRWLMILGFGGLVMVSVGAVLYMSVTTNFASTFSLLNKQAVQLLDGMERSIRSETQQAERAVLAVAELYEKDNLAFDPPGRDRRQSQQELLQSIMITAPVVEALLIYDLQGQRSGIFRTPKGEFGPIPFAPGDQLKFTKSFAGNSLAKTRKPIWGEPVTLNGILFHYVGYRLEKEGNLVGYAVATIGQHNLNHVVASLGRDNDTTVFVLTGDNRVVAHSRMPEYFRKKSLVKLEDFPDQSLKLLPTARQLNHFGENDTQNMKVYESGRGSGNIYITRKLPDYASSSYSLGAYFAKADAGTEIMRAMKSALAGVAALILAIIASVFLSKRLSRPMQRISAVANDFSNLKLENFTPLPASRVREIDEQGKAMNSMHTALSEFSQYIPRTLVKRLMAPGSKAIRSVEREITILFSDIVGFTSMTEEFNAVDTASLLNQHFDIVCGEISKHNGTVDKFIGDGLMAFWGAPDADDNQAINALKAASDIIDALDRQNQERAEARLPAMRVRIGIHTGRVVVGNIGSSQRHNYTLVGDAVNVANRLEQHGKHHMGNAQAIVMASAATWEAAGKPDNMHNMGLTKLRGRDALIRVFAMGKGIDTGIEIADQDAPAQRDVG
jgi:adenylate cyclase